MVIGLKFGRVRADDNETKERTYELVNRFAERFLAEKGSLVCRDLVGIDISTPEGLAGILASREHHENCRGIVKTACRLLEDLLDD